MKKNRLTSSDNSGFQIPDGYMENLENRIMSRAFREMAEDCIPENPEKVFAVPQNYFDSLEERLMTALPQLQKKESKLIALFNKEAFYYISGVAAVLVAVVFNISVQQSDVISMENLDMLSLENYLEETMDYSNPELQNSFGNDNFGFATTSGSQYIDQEAVMDYLHENLEEPSLIFNDN